MKFAKTVFQIAGAWGVVLLVPMYFLIDVIGRKSPPAVTHAEFFYGFVGVALAWQVAFFIIASDPLRYRPLMLPSMLEKVSFATAVIALFLQNRMPADQLIFAAADLLLAALMLMAFVKVGRYRPV